MGTVLHPQYLSRSILVLGFKSGWENLQVEEFVTEAAIALKNLATE